METTDNLVERNSNQSVKNRDTFSTQSQAFIFSEDINAWNDQGYTVERFGDKPSVVLLGELHATPDQQQKQMDLILQLKPEYVLDEAAAGQMYDPQARKFTRLAGRKFNYIDDILRDEGPPPVAKRILEAANAIGFKIIGCDTTSAEEEDIERKIAQKYPEEYEYEEAKFGGILRKRGDPDWQLLRGDELQMPFRDESMAATITEYQSKTKKPVVVIVGAAHASNISQRGLIKDKGFGYFHIDQSARSK